MKDTIKYLDKINDIKNRYSIPYIKENMKEDHYVEIMYEELSIEMIKEIERLNNIIKEVREYIASFNLLKDLGALEKEPISISELKHILELLDIGDYNEEN